MHGPTSTVRDPTAVERLQTYLALGGLLLLALGVRVLAPQDVFLPDGSVFLAMSDTAYHARRVLVALANFPFVVHWDPYMAYPDGSPSFSPPLYDCVLAAAAWTLG